jgi:hypothetical protein
MWWLVVFAETKRGLGADEEPYTCTVTIPDDAIAPVSAKNTGYLTKARCCPTRSLGPVGSS